MKMIVNMIMNTVILMTIRPHKVDHDYNNIDDNQAPHSPPSDDLEPDFFDDHHKDYYDDIVDYHDIDHKDDHHHDYNNIDDNQAPHSPPSDDLEPPAGLSFSALGQSPGEGLGYQV